MKVTKNNRVKSKRYRITKTYKWYRIETDDKVNYIWCPTFKIQMKYMFWWITIKSFLDTGNPQNANEKSQDMLNQLNS